MLRRIGRGGFGEVWLARSATGTYRAVKVVRRDAFEDDRTYEREFKGVEQAEPISREHPSQTDILHVGRNDEAGYYFYVMELADDVVTGQRIDAATYEPRTLSSELKRRGRLPVKECLQIAASLAQALGHLHSHRLAHRDVKPANVVFVQGAPKLADIGLTAKIGDSNQPESGGDKPPVREATAGENDAQALALELVQADLHALALTLYEMSTGRSGRDEFPQLPADFAHLPDRVDLLELNRVFEKACVGDPRERYQTAKEMEEQLLLLQEDKSARQLQSLKRWLRVVGYGAAVLVAVGGAGVREYYLRTREAVLIELQHLRLRTHENGWSSKAWARTRDAATLRNGLAFRSQAAAVLVGWDATLHRHLTNHGAAAVCFDPTGQRLLASSLSGNAIWIDAQSGTIAPSGVPGNGPATITEEGRAIQLARVGSHRYQLWDVASAKLLGTFELPPLADPAPLPEQTTVVSALAANGTVLALGGEASTQWPERVGRYAVWASTNPAPAFEVPRPVQALAVSPDGTLVAAGGDDGVVEVRFVATGKELFLLPVGECGVRGLAFGRDPLVRREGSASARGWLLAVGDTSGTTAIWSLTDRRVRTLSRDADWQVSVLCFSPDATLLASGGRLKVRLMDVATGQVLLELGSADNHTGVAFSNDGRKLATCNGPRSSNEKGDVYAWDLENGRGIQSLHGLGTQNTRMAFSADGRYAAAVGQNWQIGIWDLERGRLVHLLEGPIGYTADNAGLAFSPDGRQFAASLGQEAYLWDTETGRCLEKWAFPVGLVDRLAFPAPDKLLLFRCETRDGMVGPFTENDPARHPRVAKVRNLLAGDGRSPILTFTNFNRRVHDAAFSADRRIVAIEGLRDRPAGQRTEYVALDLDTGRVLWTTPSNEPGGLRVEADSARVQAVIATNAEQAALIVNLLDGVCFGRLPLIPGALSLESGLCVYHTPLNWELARIGEAREPLLTLAADSHRGSSCPAFSLDGRRLIWGAKEGTVFVADLPGVRRRLQAIGLDW